MRRTPWSTRQSPRHDPTTRRLGAAGFVNAVLRNFLRQQPALVDRLQQLDEVRYNAPRWWIDAMRAAQPGTVA